MGNFLKVIFTLAFIALTVQGCFDRRKTIADYPIKPLPFTSVQLTDNFWVPRIKRIVAVPMEKRSAWLPGTDTSENVNLPLSDEFFRIIEGSGYSLQIFRDIEQEKFIDTLVSRITLQPDGNVRILNDKTSQNTIAGPGYLYQAASVHFQATGKRNLLEVAQRSADSILNVHFSDSSAVIYDVEMIQGLLSLYRATQDRKYLEKAAEFMTCHDQNGNPAVSAALTELRVLTGDTSALFKAHTLFKNIAYNRMSITGGIRNADSAPLPGKIVMENADEISECIDAIGFFRKLFLLTGDSEYYNLIERMLYNSVLSGISLTADKYSCNAPLSSEAGSERAEWTMAGRCRTAIGRFLPSLPEYIYASEGSDIYLNLLISNNVVFTAGRKKVSLSVKENLPWEEKIEISIDPEAPVKFNLRIRIPEWSQNNATGAGKYRYADSDDHSPRFLLNGHPVDVPVEKGYCVFSGKWAAGDRISIDMPLHVRKIISASDSGNIVLQRGPLVYCTEGIDNNKGNMSNLMLDDDSVSAEFVPGMLNGVQVVRASGYPTKRDMNGDIMLLPSEKITLIPYAFWNNRGPGSMRVWLPVVPENTRPLPAPTLAYRSWLTGTRKENLTALKDQVFPANSNDETVPVYDWRPVKGNWVWIQYDLPEPSTISRTRVYWFDNGDDIRVPDEWEMLYLKENIWTPVKPGVKFPVEKDTWNIVSFGPVTVSSVKIKARLKRGASGGMYEWIIE